VATYTLKKIAAKAYQKEEWTSNIMMIRVGNLIVINTYASEGWKAEITNSVTRLSRQCLTDGLDVIAVGDFNIIP
jgi:hypothetical protein